MSLNPHHLSHGTLTTYLGLATLAGEKKKQGKLRRSPASKQPKKKGKEGELGCTKVRYHLNGSKGGKVEEKNEERRKGEREKKKRAAMCSR